MYCQPMAVPESLTNARHSCQSSMWPQHTEVTNRIIWPSRRKGHMPAAGLLLWASRWATPRQHVQPQASRTAAQRRSSQLITAALAALLAAAVGAADHQRPRCSSRRRPCPGPATTRPQRLSWSTCGGRCCAPPPAPRRGATCGRSFSFPAAPRLSCRTTACPACAARFPHATCVRCGMSMHVTCSYTCTYPLIIPCRGSVCQATGRKECTLCQKSGRSSSQTNSKAVRPASF